jgi:serine/threonine-protein kinase
VERIGRYVVREEIARGGMGVVYRAHDPELGRDVALKLLIPACTFDKSSAERLEREALALSKLRHRNIVRLHSVGTHQGAPFLVQDFVEGPTLSERILREGFLPVAEAAALIRDLAGALQVAHDQTICHRDVKPSNVIMSPAGPVLVDFGIAKDVAASLFAPTLTKSGVGMGTPGYWSPEQALGERRSVGVPSDVYSLGATLYAALVGRPPFVGGNLQGNAVLTVSLPATAPSASRKEIPASLEAIVLKCLEKDQADRYGSAAELAEDLARFLDGDEVLAHPVRPRRRGALVLSAIALLVALALAALAAFVGTRDEAPHSSEEVAIDDVAPVLELSAPLPWGATAAQAVVLRGTVEDELPVTVSVGATSATFPPGAFRLEVPLEPGLNNLSVSVEDGAGNKGKTVTLPFLRAPTSNDNSRLLASAGYAPGRLEYEIARTIEIAPDEVLVLEAGTVLKFAPGAGIDSRGQIWCLGSESAPVRLEANEPVLDARAPGGGWDGVVVRSPRARSVFSWTTLDGAKPDMTALTLSGGARTKSNRQRRGGALTALDGARVHMADSVVRRSRPPGSNRGGGLFAEGGRKRDEVTRVDVWRTRFEACWATNGGGAKIGPNVTASFRDCVFAGNAAIRGGGLSIEATGGVSFLESVQFLNNKSERYGGGVILERSATFRRCVFRNNTAGSGPAGIVIKGPSATSFGRFNEASGQQLVLQDCQFEGNDPAQPKAGE